MPGWVSDVTMILSWVFWFGLKPQLRITGGPHLSYIYSQRLDRPCGCWGGVRCGGWGEGCLWLTEFLASIPSLSLNLCPLPRNCSFSQKRCHVFPWTLASCEFLWPTKCDREIWNVLAKWGLPSYTSAPPWEEHALARPVIPGASFGSRGGCRTCRAEPADVNIHEWEQMCYCVPLKLCACLLHSMIVLIADGYWNWYQEWDVLATKICSIRTKWWAVGKML